jgi:GntR family transcriptional regulator / MocR family aminotransferase
MQYTDYPLDGLGAIYEQLARAMKRAILEGRLLAGNRLPSTRILAATLGVSRNTVLGAYEVLRAEQLIAIHDRSGTRVAEIAQPFNAVQAHSVVGAQSRYTARMRKLGSNTLGSISTTLPYDLHYGEPISDPYLFQAWRRKLSAAALVAGPRYPDAVGFLPLRKAIAEYLGRRRGVLCTEKDIVIVGGTQQAVTLAARVLLDEGDLVGMEDPHYLYALQALKAHGARIISIPVDADGIVTSNVAKHKPRMICVTPSHQFPSGAVLSLKRRMDLLRIATQQNSWILEDDYDSEFQYRGRPIAALRSLDLSGRVIYVGSFSKTLFPSLRLGYIVCPPGLRDDFLKAKRLDDLGCPAIEQAALAAFMQSRQFEKRLQETVAELGRRRTALLDGLHRYAGDHIEFRDTQAGMHVAVWLRGFTYRELDRLIDIGIKNGLGLYPIHPHYQKQPTHPGLLMGFAGLSTESLRQACKIFGQCVDDIN